MALLNAGYWQTTYWAENYWNPRYWPKYGVAALVAPTLGHHVPRRRRRIKPNFFLSHMDEWSVLQLYLMLKRKRENMLFGD